MYVTVKHVIDICPNILISVTPIHPNNIRCYMAEWGGIHPRAKKKTASYLNSLGVGA